MPDGDKSHVGYSKGHVQEFLKWVQQYYGKRLPFSEEFVLQNWKNPSKWSTLSTQVSGSAKFLQDAWGYWWGNVGSKGGVAKVEGMPFEEQLARGEENPYAISYLDTPTDPDQLASFKVSGQRTYVDRATEFLNQLMYSGAISQQERAAHADEIARRIQSGEKLENLPWYDVLTRNDFPDYFQYFVGQAKEKQQNWADMQELNRAQEQYAKDYAAWSQSTKTQTARQKGFDVTVAQQSRQMFEQQQATDRWMRELGSTFEGTGYGQQLAEGLAGVGRPQDVGQPRVPTAAPALDVGGEFSRYLGNLPYAQQRFFSSRPEEVFGNMTELQEAREIWWASLQNLTAPASLTAGQSLERVTEEREALRRAYGTFGGGPQTLAQRSAAGEIGPEGSTSYQMAAMLAPRLQSANERAARLQAQTAQEVAEYERYGGPAEEPLFPNAPKQDPILARLQQYPWRAAYYSAPPSARGFYSGRYSPTSRWSFR